MLWTPLILFGVDFRKFRPVEPDGAALAESLESQIGLTIRLLAMGLEPVFLTHPVLGADDLPPGTFGDVVVPLVDAHVELGPVGDLQPEGEVVFRIGFEVEVLGQCLPAGNLQRFAAEDEGTLVLLQR